MGKRVFIEQLSTDRLQRATPAKPSNWSFRMRALLLLALGFFACPCALAFDARGGQFLGFTSLSAFKASPGDLWGEVVLTSSIITARLNWNELIASWNAEMPDGAYLKLEARGLYPGRSTKYFTLALWSGDATLHPRESVPKQKDADGDVLTDTLKLSESCERLQLRLTLGGEQHQEPKVKFLGVCLLDSTKTPTALPPNRAAWGHTLPVPERSQMAYPNGKVLCSPTTVSMMMTYWSAKLNRPEIDHDVPDIVHAVYDANWKGTGNWPFNMAYAGSYPGLRAYVTRMSDVSELEDWIGRGIPVGLSVCYDRLRAKGPGPNGHLVVCVGFTTNGDLVINDPGTSKNVRKIFPRKNLISAWAYSKNAAYLIYPESVELPKDRFGHWDSRTSRQRIRIGKYAP